MTKTELKMLLVNARKSKNLTHEQVAELVSNYLPNGKRISRQYYGMIENNDRTPSVEVAKAIANVLEISWTIFFETESNHSLHNDMQTKKEVI